MDCHDIFIILLEGRPKQAEAFVDLLDNDEHQMMDMLLHDPSVVVANLSDKEKMVARASTVSDGVQ